MGILNTSNAQKQSASMFDITLTTMLVLNWGEEKAHPNKDRIIHTRPNMTHNIYEVCFCLHLSPHILSSHEFLKYIQDLGLWDAHWWKDIFTLVRLKVTECNFKFTATLTIPSMWREAGTY